MLGFLPKVDGGSYADAILSNEGPESDMLNWFAKLLLVATSLSPILGAISVNQISLGKAWCVWLPWLAAAIGLVVLCWILLWYAERNAQAESVEIKQFESNDTEVLAFLLAYLLPFISSRDMAFEGQWLTGAYILAIIFMVIAHAGAFHFNPVMGLLGYHFYRVRNGQGVSVLLISKAALVRPEQAVETVKLSHNIYLQRTTRRSDA